MSGSWVSGWVTNDIVTAAEFRKGAGAVYDTTLGGTAATIDTGATLPITYATMEIEVYARCDAAVLGNALWLRLNGDTGANYDYQYSQATAGTLSGVEGFAQNVIDVGFAAGASAPAGAFTQTTIEIVNYGNVVGQKAVYARCAHKQGTATGTLIVRQTAAFWRPTGAGVNRITLLPSTGSFVTGTRVTVRVKGA